MFPLAATNKLFFLHFIPGSETYLLNVFSNCWIAYDLVNNNMSDTQHILSILSPLRYFLSTLLQQANVFQSTLHLTGCFILIVQIRNVEQLRLRFKIFPTAFQFSFMPVENTEERRFDPATLV